MCSEFYVLERLLKRNCQLKVKWNFFFNASRYIMALSEDNINKQNEALGTLCS